MHAAPYPDRGRHHAPRIIQFPRHIVDATLAAIPFHLDNDLTLKCYIQGTAPWTGNTDKLSVFMRHISLLIA
jgi:hypothetical protein